MVQPMCPRLCWRASDGRERLGAKLKHHHSIHKLWTEKLSRGNVFRARGTNVRIDASAHKAAVHAAVRRAGSAMQACGTSG